MLKRETVMELAERGPFEFDASEKVLRLAGILRRIVEHEATAGRWVLKGGTALNLFHLGMPRLSVDLDLNYVGHEGVEELKAERPRFEQALALCARLEDCEVQRQPPDHAGGKYRLRYPSLNGGARDLELDVNYVQRVPLLGVERRKLTLTGVGDVEVPLLHIAELAAGKFAALASRAAARDYFDADRLLEVRPELVSDPEFRVAFVTIAASARQDYLDHPGRIPTLTAQDVRQRLLPLLPVETGTSQDRARSLAERLADRVVPAAREAVRWNKNERAFLEGVNRRGEVLPELLTGDSGLRSRIARQPMLVWKCGHVAAHRASRRPPAG
jgi:hypothetical protein